MLSQMFTARLAGLFYLCVAITGFLPYSVRQKLVVSGDASATVSNVLASPLLYTTSIVSDVVMTAFWIATAVTLYALLFRGAYKMLGLAMVAFVLAGSAVVLASALMHVAAWKLVGGGDYLTPLALEQRQALALLTLEVGQSGVMVASLFFGLWLFPLSFLVWRSGCFPRRVGPILAGLLAIAGLGYLADFFLAFFMPGISITFAQSTFLGELLLLLWLLFRGCGESKLNSERSIETRALGAE
jgi:hypothetical protein